LFKNWAVRLGAVVSDSIVTDTTSSKGSCEISSPSGLVIVTSIVPVALIVKVPGVLPVVKVAVQVSLVMSALTVEPPGITSVTDRDSRTNSCVIGHPALPVAKLLVSAVPDTGMVKPGR
jgi:hypothetical protein